MKKKVRPYIPENAGLNFDNKESEPPKPKYERTKAIFNLDVIRKLVKGKYGRNH
jgi:hypothetical protein